MDVRAENASVRGDVGVLHHFVGDDSAAMDELIASAEGALPAVEIGTTEDPQTSMRAKTDILRGSPPDVWDDWPGANLVPYWEAGVLADITDVWEMAGFEDAFVDVAREAASIDGRYHAVPLNVQRQNNLFYNVDVVRRAGVDPERIRGPEDLLEAMEQVEDATDSAGFMLPQNHPWPAFDVWDTLVASVGGAEVYEEIYRGGRPTRHRRVIRDAFASLERYREFVPDDATYDSWQPALERFAGGEAAFYCMGDWAAGVLNNRDGFAYGEDWGAVAFPGTHDVFQVVMDSLMVPTTTDQPDAARAVVAHAGSKRALERFTRVRGALPPRTDVPMDGYDEFFRRQMANYRNASAEVMATRGTGIRPSRRVELITTMATFLADDRGPKAAADAVVDALSG
ncbi:ABC transporter substrate-binding protein [Natrarchaeobius sp. A-rgal3]|uniref:ABC transporter substrate-binding protein n=1 Tax=Natrarchaeobius versutus TaxID=1679078 RepID=UPI00350F3C41